VRKVSFQNVASCSLHFITVVFGLSEGTRVS